MSATRSGLPFLALVGLASAGLVLGLLAVGSPWKARQDRFDDARLSDLRALADALRCDPKGRALPDPLDRAALERFCPDGRGPSDSAFFDPETGAPYALRRIDDQRYELCATFADATRMAVQPMVTLGPYSFDATTGCVLGQVY